MATYSPVGGQRASSDELMGLRQRVLSIATQHGYPEPARLQRRNDFDRALGVTLHTTSGMTAGEASLGPIWAFLALQLMPDVCAWRFPANSAGQLTPDRFKAGDLTRHTLARTWTRAHVLRQQDAADPYELLGGIAEADLDQIMARRRSVAASPALVREVVQCHREQGSSHGIPARAILRDSLIRLLRLAAFVNVDALLATELRELVLECRQAAVSALAVA